MYYKRHKIMNKIYFELYHELIPSEIDFRIKIKIIFQEYF